MKKIILILILLSLLITVCGCGITEETHNTVTASPTPNVIPEESNNETPSVDRVEPAAQDDRQLALLNEKKALAGEYVKNEDFVNAINLYNEIISIEDATGNRTRKAEIIILQKEALIKHYSDNKQYPEAIAAVNELMALNSESDYRNDLIHIKELMALNQLESGEFTKAKDLYLELYTETELTDYKDKITSIENELEAYLTVSNLYSVLNDFLELKNNDEVKLNNTMMEYHLLHISNAIQKLKTIDFQEDWEISTHYNSITEKVNILSDFINEKESYYSKSQELDETAALGESTREFMDSSLWDYVDEDYILANPDDIMSTMFSEISSSNITLDSYELESRITPITRIQLPVRYSKLAD